ncbi:MAG: alkaline phosphatase family protein, partial [Anaerolineales bacterium]|nr:alkaline phosphatase family protein [Anaerolineales bacterium]
MNKLLVVGLDGATFDLILPWAAQGRLPLFARWLAAGAHGRCRSVPNTDTAPAWATFATGLSPANHGLFGEWRWSADRHTLQPAQGADRHGAAFWELAAAAGRRVLVVNVPFTYPAAPLDGVLLTGIDAPGADAPGFCHPPDFLRAVPGYRIDSHIQAAIKENRPEAGLADAYAVEARRTDALLHAMRLGPWHVAAIVYSVPDVMQHFFWHQMAQDSGPQRHAILDSHTFIEGEIARLLAAAGPDTNLVLLSDHGFGPICATRESLADWLAAHGWTALLDPARQPWRQRVVRAAYGRLRHALGEAQKEALRRRLPAVRSRVESDVRFAGIDWRRTRAFAGASSWEI